MIPCVSPRLSGKFYHMAKKSRSPRNVRSSDRPGAARRQGPSKTTDERQIPLEIPAVEGKSSPAGGATESRRQRERWKGDRHAALPATTARTGGGAAKASHRDLRQLRLRWEWKSGAGATRGKYCPGSRRRSGTSTRSSTTRSIPTPRSAPTARPPRSTTCCRPPIGRSSRRGSGTSAKCARTATTSSTG